MSSRRLLSSTEPVSSLTDSTPAGFSGTTLIYLPQAAFEAYTQNVGGTLDDQTGMVKIPAENIDQIPDLNFLTANNITLTLNNCKPSLWHAKKPSRWIDSCVLVPDAQLVPTPLYERFQLEQGSLYSWVVGMAGDGNGGPEFIIVRCSCFPAGQRPLLIGLFFSTQGQKVCPGWLRVDKSFRCLTYVLLPVLGALLQCLLPRGRGQHLVCRDWSATRLCFCSLAVI